METRIIRETASEMRTIARNSLQGVWLKVFLGMLLFYVMTTTIPMILNEVIPFETPTYTVEGYEFKITGVNLGSLYQFIVAGAFEVGICSFFLSAFRRKDVNPGYVFNGFELFPKAFALMFMTTLFTVLWTLLFIIPGIIAAIRYSQAFYILADDPEKGVMQCIRESKMMMTGNKGRYFYTCLTFVGWAILASLPSAAASILPEGNNLLLIAVLLALDIPFIFVLAYMQTTFTAFYDLASGKLVAKTEEI